MEAGRLRARLSDGRRIVRSALPSTRTRTPLLGAIIGDGVGSVYEREPTKRTDVPLLQPHSRFTDDTVLAIATAEELLTDGRYDAAYRRWARRYPHAGHGCAFRREIAERFGDDLARSADDVRPAHGFDVSCQGSVPEALIAFLDTAALAAEVRRRLPADMLEVVDVFVAGHPAAARAIAGPL